MAPWAGSTDLKVRFRSTVSGSREDANVDNVRIVGVNEGSTNSGGSQMSSASTSNGGDSFFTNSNGESFDQGGKTGQFNSSSTTGGFASGLDQFFGSIGGSSNQGSSSSLLDDWTKKKDELDDMLNDLLFGGNLF